MNPEILKSYARALITTTLTAILAVLNSGAELDWKLYGTTIAVAVIPVLIRWLDPTDPAFGRGKQ